MTTWYNRKSTDMTYTIYCIVTTDGNEYKMYADNVKLNDNMIFFYSDEKLVGLFPTHCTMIVDVITP
jgi:hypothetical protein